MLGSSAITPGLRQNRIEHIRQLMLHELGDFGKANFSKVVVRVRYALDAEALWFMRGDVMAVLSAMHGETMAQEKIRLISKEFKGLLPKGLISRPSSRKR